MSNHEENYEAIISNRMGYEIYMMATEHLAKMIEYPSYDDWGNVKDELYRANEIRKYIGNKFPSLLDDEIQKRCNSLLKHAESVYNQRCEREREMLHRRLEYGKVTIEDVKGE